MIFVDLTFSVITDRSIIRQKLFLSNKRNFAAISYCLAHRRNEDNSNLPRFHNLAFILNFNLQMMNYAIFPFIRCFAPFAERNAYKRSLTRTASSFPKQNMQILLLLCILSVLLFLYLEDVPDCMIYMQVFLLLTLHRFCPSLPVPFLTGLDIVVGVITAQTKPTFCKYLHNP